MPQKISEMPLKINYFYEKALFSMIFLPPKDSCSELRDAFITSMYSLHILIVVILTLRYV
jgi:hypothetical protein